MNTKSSPPQPGFGESVDTSSVDVRQSTARYLVVPESDRKKPVSAAEIFTANMEKIERRVLQIAQGQDEKNRVALLKMFDLMKKMQADSGMMKDLGQSGSSSATSSKEEPKQEVLTKRAEHEIESLHQRVELAEQKAEQISLHAKEIEQEATKLRQWVIHDVQTEVLNLKGFEEAFRIEAARTVREYRLLSLVLFDFKEICLRQSHLPTTELNSLLQHVAKIIQTCVRPHDALARVDETEFAVLLSGASTENALIVIDRLMQELKRREPIFNGQPLELLVHAGITPIEKGTSLKTALKRAKQDLEKSKAQQAPAPQETQEVVMPTPPPAPSLGILSSLKGSFSKYRKGS